MATKNHLWRAPRPWVERYLSHQGLEVDAVETAIDMTAGDRWAVDTTHAIWRLHTASQFPPSEDFASQWAGVHALSYVLTTTDEQFSRALQSLANTPDRRRQLAADLEAHPVTRPFELWLNGFRNRLNDRLGKPQYTLEQSRLAHPLAIHMTDSGGGLGDTVVGLYAACGLADLLGRPLVYHAKWSDWIERASYPNLIIKPHRGDIGLDMSGGWEGQWGYNNATKSAPSRLWAYCTNTAVGFGLPAFKPARPSIDTMIRESSASGRYAVIAPFSSQWPAREWPMAKFTALAAALVDRGFQVIAVGSPNQLERMERTFGPVIGTSWQTGFPPSHVTNLVLGAAVVVGNDSGIVHLGGLLGVPTVAIHAGSLPHEYLFHLAPSVTSVTAAEQRGRSDAHQGALATVPVDRVMQAVVAAAKNDQRPG